MAEYTIQDLVIKIPFLLNFTLFPEYPEFYSTYQFLNAKNYAKYSDKLRLCVLNLTRIDLADEEDKRYHLDMLATQEKTINKQKQLSDALAQIKK